MCDALLYLLNNIYLISWYVVISHPCHFVPKLFFRTHFLVISYPVTTISYSDYFLLILVLLFLLWPVHTLVTSYISRVNILINILIHVNTFCVSILHCLYTLYLHCAQIICLSRCGLYVALFLIKSKIHVYTNCVIPSD